MTTTQPIFTARVSLRRDDGIVEMLVGAPDEAPYSILVYPSRRTGELLQSFELISKDGRDEILSRVTSDDDETHDMLLHDISFRRDVLRACEEVAL